jgi:5-methyltetrahydrofolate--homocysteine methyltransferase
LIGERTNANGSKKFRELLKAEDYAKMVTFAKGQVQKGAHALDVCVSVIGKNEVDYITAVIPRFNQHIDSPLMIDSTDPIAIEEALKRISGKAMVNSVNLENGEEQFAETLRICKRYGAAVVALTIDEEGMAKSAEKKFGIAKRMYELAVDECGFDPNNILYDPLTFTLATGDESSRRMGVETLNAIKLIKEKIPQSQVILGVSNISYGLPRNARKALNSVFLHDAVSAGLDLAIFNVAHFLPLHKLDEKAINLSLNLIHNKKENALSEFMEYFSDATLEPEDVIEEELSPEEALERKVIDGEKGDLTEVLERVLNDRSPSEILNQILLPAMETVGKRFGNGEMPLPFVLQSAEAMKTAVTILEPKMETGESEEKGKLLLATVKGDVHDIGKNLVNIILRNNGFDVVDLGIRQSISNIIAGIKEHEPDALGMSGLLVKSTVIMKENLQILNEHGISIPVIVGGAALSRNYVEIVLQNVYHGRVYYAKDAFEGLKIMRELSIYRRFP